MGGSSTHVTVHLLQRVPPWEEVVAYEGTNEPVLLIDQSGDTIRFYVTWTGTTPSQERLVRGYVMEGDEVVLYGGVLIQPKGDPGWVSTFHAHVSIHDENISIDASN